MLRVSLCQCIMQAEVRRMYRVLQEEDQENFQGFDLSQGYVALRFFCWEVSMGQKQD